MNVTSLHIQIAVERNIAGVKKKQKTNEIYFFLLFKQLFPNSVVQNQFESAWKDWGPSPAITV